MPDNPAQRLEEVGQPQDRLERTASWDSYALFLLPDGISSPFKAPKHWPHELQQLYENVAFASERAETLRYSAAGNNPTPITHENLSHSASLLMKARSSLANAERFHTGALPTEIKQTFEVVQLFLSKARSRAGDSAERYLSRIRTVPNIPVHVVVPVMLGAFEAMSKAEDQSEQGQLPNVSRQAVMKSTSHHHHEPQAGQPKEKMSLVKKKKSTEEGEARSKLIAALTSHHRHGDEHLNLEPIGCRQLTRKQTVSVGSVSAFFKKEFGSHAKYKVACRNEAGLRRALQMWNGELPWKAIDLAKVPV